MDVEGQSLQISDTMDVLSGKNLSIGRTVYFSISLQLESKITRATLTQRGRVVGVCGVGIQL